MGQGERLRAVVFPILSKLEGCERGAESVSSLHSPYMVDFEFSCVFPFNTQGYWLVQLVLLFLMYSFFVVHRKGNVGMSNENRYGV